MSILLLFHTFHPSDIIGLTFSKTQLSYLFNGNSRFDILQSELGYSLQMEFKSNLHAEFLEYNYVLRDSAH